MDKTKPQRIFIDSATHKPEHIIPLGDYHPYWISKRDKEKNPDFDSWSAYILEMKRDSKDAIQFFYNKLEPILGVGFAISVVPSHDPRKTLSGLRSLAQRVAANGRIDATSCLVRHTKIPKLSYGGDRSIDLHIQSIRVINHDLIRDREVLLLDDVSTTGNSLKACRKLLLESGAKEVQCMALGITVR